MPSSLLHSSLIETNSCIEPTALSRALFVNSNSVSSIEHSFLLPFAALPFRFLAKSNINEFLHCSGFHSTDEPLPDFDAEKHSPSPSPFSICFVYMPLTSIFTSKNAQFGHILTLCPSGVVNTQQPFHSSRIISLRFFTGAFFQ